VILRPHPSFADDELQKKHILYSSKNDSYLHKKLQVHKVNVKKRSNKERRKKEKQERSILFVNIRFIQRKLKFCSEKHNKTSLHSNPLSQVTTVQVR